jgi:hypothetical protein
MKTHKYLKSLQEGSGHLNPFPIKKTESSPDYGGYLKINGQNYRIVAWVKENNGRKTLSIKANEADDEGVPTTNYQTSQI